MWYRRGVAAEPLCKIDVLSAVEAEHGQHGTVPGMAPANNHEYEGAHTTFRSMAKSPRGPRMAMGNGGHTRGAGGGHGNRAGRGHAESKSHTNQQSVSASVQQQKGCRQQHRTLAWGEATAPACTARRDECRAGTALVGPRSLAKNACVSSPNRLNGHHSHSSKHATRKHLLKCPTEIRTYQQWRPARLMI